MRKVSYRREKIGYIVQHSSREGGDLLDRACAALAVRRIASSEHTPLALASVDGQSASAVCGIALASVSFWQVLISVRFGGP